MKSNANQWLLAAIFSAVSLTACHHQAAKLSAADAINSAVIHKPPNDDRHYAAILLSNQLQVVLISDPSLESSAAALGVGVGSAQDPEAQPGLAHYLEHMLFLGTKQYPVANNFMDFIGKHAGMGNANTGFSRTNYFFTVNAAQFDEALARYSDYFKSPLLDPQYADRERHVVNAEWSKTRDQDGWILHSIEGLTANPDNPRSRFSIGNLETLADKEDSKLQDELNAFFKQYYSANNMRLTLVGKQSIPELRALAEKYFKDIPNNNIPIPKVTVPGLTQAQMGKIISYASQKNLKGMGLQFPIKDNKTHWRAKPNQIVASILGSQEEGALSNQLHKMGLANRLDVSVVADAYGPDGYLQFDIELTDLGFRNRDKVVAAVFAYIARVKQQGIDKSYFVEFQAIKARDFASGGKANPLQQAMAVTANQFDYPLANLLDAHFVYDKFEQGPIDELLQQLQPANVRIWYIGLNEFVDKSVPYSKGKYSIRDITEQDRLRWSELEKAFDFNLPAINTLVTATSADIVPNFYIKPKQIVSEKGIELFLAQPEFYREDKGVLDIELNVPFAQASAKNLVLSYLLSDIYQKKYKALIDRADRAGLRVNAAVGATGSQFINIEGYTGKHQELLTTLLSGFADLTISDSEFMQVSQTYKGNLINSKKNQLQAQAMGNAQRLQSSAPWTAGELLAAANKVSGKDVIEYHKLVKSNLLLRIFAFGNYSEDTAKYFASIAKTYLPGTRMPSQRIIPQFAMPEIGKDKVFNEKVNFPDNVLVDIYQDEKKSLDDVAKVVVLNAVYGNAFFKQLRIDEQLGYAVYSFPSSAADYAGFGMLVQSSNTDLAGIKSRMDRFRHEFLPQLQALDPVQIEQIKQAEAASLLERPSNFYGESKLHAMDFWYGHYNFDQRERYTAALAKVDKASLIELYQRLLLDKKSMNILVQLQGTQFQERSFPPVNP